MSGGHSQDPNTTESRSTVPSGSMTRLDCPSQENPQALTQNQSEEWTLSFHAPDLHVPPQDHGIHLNADSAACGVNADANGWHIPDAVAYDLVGLYFDYIQNWLPILHRPLFYQRYVRNEGCCAQVVGREHVCDDDAILINGIFALAARFSKASFFSDTDPIMRGDIFAERAAALKDLALKAIEEPSLELVKGCVLLAFYNICAGHAAPGSLLVSVCVRFAYDLGLNEIDEDDKVFSGAEGEDQDAWIRREELRRIWWVIYELDCFVSTLSCQPYGIERGEIRVLLPVPDHEWFNGLPVGSSHLIQSPGAVWTSLAGSKNQSPRAWYLVANYLKSCIADAARQSKRNTSDLQAALEMDVACLKHALPAGFQLREMNMNENNFGGSNWIVSTHFMILSCCMINPWDALAARHEPNVQCYEISKLLLGHYSRYWKIGGALIRLLSIISEGRDSATYQPGSHERTVIKRFSVLCPSSSKGRNSEALKHDAQFPYETSDVPAETLSESNLTGQGDPSGLQWPLSLWNNLQAFDSDQPDIELLSIPSGSHVGGGVNGPIGSFSGAQLRIPNFSLPFDASPDEFVAL
ncbi:uncharacterized protein Z520_06871 [Fonsecaea multimorphosa CBS 102226]|uniref:Xylanolytic transcriptional activator regulatory domain-containing protein n=1 Tax=Fonsecaea multimorphosa CBS 102226 TaxID=1442371 RepID=A0A0D2K2Y2_9EURO|nr:uncharacterized protein Z520_06871 [Fonsecaea multimorphosa CBS 102226]KIX97419.1 hypothetical protein Z520_06871 [Fonsecaea multimorphosa CBS 102226]